MDSYMIAAPHASKDSDGTRVYTYIRSRTPMVHYCTEQVSTDLDPEQDSNGVRSFHMNPEQDSEGTRTYT